MTANAAPVHSVAVIAHTRETLDSLEDHMRTAGLLARRARFLGHWQEMASGCKLALLFPDEFPAAAVEAALSDLEAHPIGLIIVTSSPRRFDVWLSKDHSNHGVLPKPVWSWNIIDSMRGWLTLSTRDRVAPSNR
jgi:hypothetical protein